MTFPPDKIEVGMCYLTTKGQVRWVIPAAFMLTDGGARPRRWTLSPRAGRCGFVQASQAASHSLRDLPIEPERQLADRGFLVC